MTKQITLGELVEYILKNRRGNAFKGYSEPTIAQSIIDALKTETMLYAVNDSDKLVGVIVCQPDDNKKLMFVRDILTTERWVLPKFVKIFMERRPGYKLQEWKNGITKTINTEKICRRILMKGVV